MIFAIAGAALAFFFVSEPVSTWAVKTFMAFDSPDDNDNWEAAIFFAVNVSGLLIGWFIGWMIAGPLSSGPRPD